MAELLPLVDVGDVDLHTGHVHRLQRVQNGHAVMGIGAGIHHDALIYPVGLLDGVHDGPFVVGLEAVHLHPVFPAEGFQVLAERGIAVFSIDSRLPLAQQIQVGAVDDQILHPYNTSRMARTVWSGVSNR